MHVATPMPAAIPYWNFIKDSSNEVKLNLITLLSMSIEEELSHSDTEDGKALKPYTLEELRGMIAKSEQEYAMGEYYSQEEAHQQMNQFVQQRTRTA
ncbi:MAG: hypothetical protein IJ635_02015 [Bacteroidaceae bacterium]|nr:hypothetical protein [Bacteroidaceae bacterium]